MCCMHICHRAGISPADALLQHHMEHVESQKKQTLPHIIHYCNYITSPQQLQVLLRERDDFLREREGTVLTCSAILCII